MTFLKSVKSAVALLAVAGVLVFAGGAFAGDPDVDFSDAAWAVDEGTAEFTGTEIDISDLDGDAVEGITGTLTDCKFDFSVDEDEYEDGIVNAGSYPVILTLSGCTETENEGKYLVETHGLSFVVTPKALVKENLELSAAEAPFVNNSTPVTPVTVGFTSGFAAANSNLPDLEASDYSLEYKLGNGSYTATVPAAKGTYSIKVTFAGTSNYTSAAPLEWTDAFEIKEAPSVTAVWKAPVTGTSVYNGSVPTVTTNDITVTVNLAGKTATSCVGVATAPSGGGALAAAAGEYTYSLSVAGCSGTDADEINALTGSIKYTIAKKTLAASDFVKTNIPTSGSTAPTAANVTLVTPLSATGTTWSLVYGTGNASSPAPGTSNAVKLKFTAVSANYSNQVNDIIDLGVTYQAPQATHIVTYGVSGGNGTISAASNNNNDNVPSTGKLPEGSGPVTQGAIVTFTAAPAAGYQVAKWELGGEEVANNKTTSFSPAAITGAITVQVFFESIPQVTVTLSGYDADKFQVNRPVTWVAVYKVSRESGLKFAASTVALETAADSLTFKFASGSIPDTVGGVGYLTHKIKYVDTMTIADTIKGTLPGAVSGTYAFTPRQLVNGALVARGGTGGNGSPPSNFTPTKGTGFPTSAPSIKPKTNIPASWFEIDVSAKTYNGKGQPVTKAELFSERKTQVGADAGAGTLTYDVLYTRTTPNDGITAGKEGPTDAGTYSVTVTASNNYYTGSTTKAGYKINPKLLKDVTSFSVGTTVFTYSGEENEASLTIKDGTYTLQLDTDYEGAPSNQLDVNSNPTIYVNNIDAGEAVIKVRGIGNYSGERTGTFKINRKRVYIDTSSIAVLTKTYDGKSAIDTTEIAGPDGKGISFMDAASFGASVGVFEKDSDYTVTGDFVGASNDTKASDVSAAKRAKLTFTLINNGKVSKNFTLVAANLTNGGSADVYKLGASITKATPAAKFFDFTDPDSVDHRYTGRARGIGEVKWKSGLTGTPKFIVLYEGDTAKPKEVGEYLVTVNVLDTGVNFDSLSGVQLGANKYKIGEPGEPEITAWVSDTTVRQGVPLTLTVEAKAAATGGVLSYQWYRGADKVTNNGTGKSLSVNGLIEGQTYAFRVEVKNTKSAGAAGSEVGTVERTVNVTVIEPPKNLSGATVSVIGSYTYTGSAITLPADSVIVFFPPTAESDTVKLVPAVDYTVSYARNVNVGAATVSITGVDMYIGIRTATFQIVKKTPDFTDVTWKPEVIYNGSAQPITVTAAVGTGLGVATVKYDGKAEAPADAGQYVVTADFAEGTNYKAATNVALGFYRISQKTPTKSDLVYTQWPAQILVDSAKADGIGAVTLKPNTGEATITVLYSGSIDAPVDPGTYTVQVQVSNADNFTDDLVELGTYLIVEEYISVAQSGREIPNKVVVEEASVAPIKAFSASFTAGPSPVAKSAGKIAFFSSKAVKGGSLYVFDANGNAVAKVAAKQGSGKEVGSWNLKNNKGATVSEGTYVVKGALVGKDGTKEKVSFVFSVK